MRHSPMAPITRHTVFILIHLQLEVAPSFSKNEIKNPIKVFDGEERQLDLSAGLATHVDPDIGLKVFSQVVLHSAYGWVRDGRWIAVTGSLPAASGCVRAAELANTLLELADIKPSGDRFIGHIGHGSRRIQGEECAGLPGAECSAFD